MSGSNLHPGRHRRVVVTGHGGPEVLAVVEEDRPMPGPGEVRVAVIAAGVSAFDLMYRRWSRLPGRPRPPFTLGQDVVGTVDAVGEGVRSLALLERGGLAGKMVLVTGGLVGGGGDL